MGTINDMIRKLENFQREIENLSGKTITIIPDAKGMIDRQCPKEECNSFFKVNAEDWKNIVKSEEVFCPFCRNNSKSQDYLPAEQRATVVKSIRRSIMDNWNYGSSMLQNITSVTSSEEFELNIQCENCNVRFAVIGAAHFCPCCGHNSIERTAKDAIDKILLQIEKIDSIQNALEQTFNKDDTAIIIKSIIENSLTDCIATLQSFCESKYNHLSSTKAPFNSFQNIEKGNKLWIALTGKGYETWLSKNEIANLLVFTQRRHLLEHKGGIVDSKYLEITNDNKYVIGSRIVVNNTDISLLGGIVLKLINSINSL